MKVEIGDPTKMAFAAEVTVAWVFPLDSALPCLCWAVLQTLKPASPFYFPISSSDNNIQQKAVSPNIPTYKDLKCKKYKKSTSKLWAFSKGMLWISTQITYFQQDREREEGERETRKSYQCHLVERPILKCPRWSGHTRTISDLYILRGHTACSLQGSVSIVYRESVWLGATVFWLLTSCTQPVIINMSSLAVQTPYKSLPPTPHTHTHTQSLPKLL